MFTIANHFTVTNFSGLRPYAAQLRAMGARANDNAVDPAKVQAQLDKNGERLALCAELGITVGTVVTFTGNKRRYAVTCVDVCGTMNLRALSGSVKGSGPSSVLPTDVTVIPGAAVEFSGAMADKLRSAYGLSCAMSRSFHRGLPVGGRA